MSCFYRKYRNIKFTKSFRSLSLAFIGIWIWDGMIFIGWSISRNKRSWERFFPLTVQDYRRKKTFHVIIWFCRSSINLIEIERKLVVFNPAFIWTFNWTYIWILWPNIVLQRTMHLDQPLMMKVCCPPVLSLQSTTIQRQKDQCSNHKEE